MTPYKSKYIFGMHDPGGEYLMAEAGKRGWILFVHALGHDPSNCPGFDYSLHADQGFAVMARLNHGYEPDGTIPHSRHHGAFAECCAQWAGKSSACHIWVIGNEMNYAVERPGVRYDRGQNPPAVVEVGEVITPAIYTSCYRLCRDAIHAVPGHEDDEVLVGAVAPWNAQTAYAGNSQGDWIRYYQDILKLLGPQRCDGITVHTYTHGAEPQLVHSETRFKSPPFDNHHYDFRAYRDFMDAIPLNMRHLPVYITETDQDVEWKNENTGWVQRAYGEIDWWNRQPGHQQILALLLYRWPRGYDKWGIEGKAGVIEDFRAAMANEYVWHPGGIPLVRGVEWLKDATPADLPSGTKVDVTLELRNSGNGRWRHDGPYPVRVGFHWRSDEGQVILTSSRSMRTSLLADVAPGDKVSVEASLWAPPEGGSFALTWDLVEEGAWWFSEKGTESLTRSVEVADPPPPDEEYFESTEYWVRGAFLEFYRRHGLEITGYPITAEFTDASSGLRTQFFQRVILEQADGSVQLQPAGQSLQAARQDISRLQSQIALLWEYLIGGGLMPPPDIRDETDTLTRDASGYFQRQPSDIRYLIINHSGLMKDIDLDRIALAHQRRGWPGITYQFYIDRQGGVHRTNPQLEVVSDSEAWAVQGVNICFAGNFSQELPSEPQLSSGAHLCAWLLQQHGLTAESIRGINEFYRTESPGNSWSGGSRWRETLIAGVSRLLASAGADDSEHSKELARLREQVQELQARLEFLQEENERLRKGIGGGAVHPPVIRDIVSLLPRDADGYRHRQRSAIRYLVIHHSALAPSVPMSRIAESHKAHGWPGTMHHYFIDSAGNVQLTSRLEEIVSDSAEWMRDGVNVCFAGDFEQDGPTQEQIASGARLCAWLLGELNLGTAALRGAKEFYDTQSPGEQWDHGIAWRTHLLNGVEEILQDAATSPVSNEALLAQVARLQLSLATAQQQVESTLKLKDQLQMQVRQLQQENERLQEETSGESALRLEIETLRAELGTSLEKIQDLEQALEQGPPVPIVVSKPHVQDVVDDLPKHDTLTYETRSLSMITHISIHHSAASASIDPWRVAAYQIKEDPSRKKDAWPGIGYHYYIGPDGTIYQTNYHQTVSYHSGGNNAHTLGLCFAGSFMDAIPTAEQMQMGGRLVAWLMQELNVPLDHVWGHKEYPNNSSTSCPGSQWLGGAKWKQLLLAQVQAVQQGLPGPFDKSIPHFLLFWWKSPGMWAERDWAGAREYVARFRPACGFSEEAAKCAQHVLIVGGTAGVSWQTENALRRAGCKVERIEGSDEEDTKRQLDELAASERPFSTFDVAAPWWR